LSVPLGSWKSRIKRGECVEARKEEEERSRRVYEERKQEREGELGAEEGGLSR